jgi:hypothetical protein
MYWICSYPAESLLPLTQFSTVPHVFPLFRLVASYRGYLSFRFIAYMQPPINYASSKTNTSFISIRIMLHANNIYIWTHYFTRFHDFFYFLHTHLISVMSDSWIMKWSQWMHYMVSTRTSGEQCEHPLFLGEDNFLGRRHRPLDHASTILS